MTFPKIIPFIVAAACLPRPCHGAGLDLILRSRAVSEPMAIEAYGDNWQGELHSGDIAWTRNRLELAARHGNWRIGYIQRYDYVIRTNEDTADLYYRDENDLPAPDGDVPVRLRAWHLRAQGARFQYRLERGDGFYLVPSLSLLDGWAFQDGALHGLLSNDDGLAGQGDLSYRYSEDLLLDHQFERPGGRGIAIDLMIGWQSERRRAELQIEDLYGRLWWDDAPYTRGVLDTVDRDDPERVHLDPAFSGVRRLEDYAQRMPLYATAFYCQDEGAWAWRLDVEYFIERVWFRPGISFPRVPGNPYVGHELRDGQWLLGLNDDRGVFHLRLGSDEQDLSDTRSLTLELGLLLQW